MWDTIVIGSGIGGLTAAARWHAAASACWCSNSTVWPVD